MKHQLRRALYIAASAALATALLPVRAHADTSSSATVNVTATVASKITITVNQSSITFGNVYPDGTGAASGFTGFAYSDGSGACYVYNTKLTATVRSNKAWTSTFSVESNANNKLRYCTALPSSLSGESDSQITAFPTSSSPATGPSGNKGTSTKDLHYVALSVLWTDDPGTFSSTVTYTATQTP